MLAPALRRNRSYGPFHDFQQCLLHTFTRHIAGDGGIIRFARDLVDFIDIHNSALRPLDIIIGGLQQFQNDVFDVFTHIARFGQRGGISHRERHIKNARQSLGQQCLTRAGRADQQDVGFSKLDVIMLGGMAKSFVMVVNRHRQHFLGMFLTNDIVIKHFANLFGGRHAVA